MKDDSGDFVTQALKVAMKSKDTTLFRDPEILAEEFLLLVRFELRTPRG